MVCGVSFLDGAERFWGGGAGSCSVWAGGADSFRVMELKQKETS